MRILGEGGDFGSLLSPPDFGGLVSLWLTDAEVPNRREGDSGQEERADRKPLGENCSRLPRMWCGAVMFTRGRSGLVTDVEEEEGGGWGTGEKRYGVDLTRKICLTGSAVIQNFNYCYYVRQFLIKMFPLLCLPSAQTFKIMLPT